MIYTATPTTVAGTLRSAPLVTTVKMTRGVLYRFEVYFPPGASGLVGVQIRTADFQLYPVQRDQWFIGDNVTIAFDDLFSLDREPFLIDVRTYNEDDTYDHLVQCRMGLVSEAEFMAKSGSFSGIEELKAILQEIEERTASANTVSKSDIFEAMKPDAHN